MSVSIKEVRSRKDLRTFAAFPNRLYRDNAYFVPQIVSMDMDTFDPRKNRAFETCEGRYFLACDGNGKVVGRVAGIINHQYNEKVGRKICRFGWIDFIEAQEVADALLERIEAYAREKGMEEIEGPVGFLEFDVSGVLVEGFDQLPTAYGKYNAPYYEEMILRNGFEKSTDFVEYLIRVPEDISRYERFAAIVAERYELHEAPIRNKRELDRYLDGVFRVMNACYAKLHGFSELSPAQCDDLKRQFLGNINLDYVSIIVDKWDEVVAFGVCLPSLSKALQKAKGHLFPFGFLHLLHALRRNDTVDALLIAILDEYKSKGVNAMISTKMGHGFAKNGIKYIESTRELEDNNSVQNIWGKQEYRLHKRARVYKKLVP